MSHSSVVVQGDWSMGATTRGRNGRRGRDMGCGRTVTRRSSIRWLGGGQIGRVSVFLAPVLVQWPGTQRERGLGCPSPRCRCSCSGQGLARPRGGEEGGIPVFKEGLCVPAAREGSPVGPIGYPAAVMRHDSCLIPHPGWRAILSSGTATSSSRVGTSTIGLWGLTLSACASWPCPAAAAEIPAHAGEPFKSAPHAHLGSRPTTGLPLSYLSEKLKPSQGDRLTTLPIAHQCHPIASTPIKGLVQRFVALKAADWDSFFPTTSRIREV
jgi:hypothetical protein